MVTAPSSSANTRNNTYHEEISTLSITEVCQGYKWPACTRRLWMWKTRVGRNGKEKYFCFFILFFFFFISTDFPKGFKTPLITLCPKESSLWIAKRNIRKDVFSSYCHPNLSQTYHWHCCASWVHLYSIRSDPNDFNFYFAVKALLLLKIFNLRVGFLFFLPKCTYSSFIQLFPFFILCLLTLPQISDIIAWCEQKRCSSAE